ncbi:MAG: S-methyl-5-thioribose-1-phosphate isomerase [Armatimonadota bacterium]|nr:S-methyl-5-thioribose-1-phosphate isomerase [bacterium]
MQRTIDYKNGKVIVIDQTRIPHELVELEMPDYESVADAIKTMKVRGAPAIGVAGALGIVVAARHSSASDPKSLYEELEQAGDTLKKTRPTAVNLFWGIDRMLDAAHAALKAESNVDDMKHALESLGKLMLQEDEDICRRIGSHGASLLPQNGDVLTHCNAGALACVGYGTALGVIRAAVEAGKRIHVYADETRPRLQGMKLTCFELVRDNIPVTVISDNMAGSFMRKGKIDCVVVGADRIAANGDVANKIGTYSVAVLAHHHGIPFYVAAPTSTIDLSLANGDDTPIEERSHEEVTHIDGHRIAPMGVEVVNPSFDVTPAAYVNAIITEKGIVYPPYKKNLR